MLSYEPFNGPRAIDRSFTWLDLRRAPCARTAKAERERAGAQQLRGWMRAPDEGRYAAAGEGWSRIVAG